MHSDHGFFPDGIHHTPPQTRAEMRAHRNAAARQDEPASRTRARVWPWLVGSLGFVVLGATAVLGVFAFQAIDVRTNLEAARADLSGIMTEVSNGRDSNVIEAAAADAFERTSHANAVVASPLWALAAGVPAVGANVDAVRDATAATHILIRDALPVGVELLSRIDPSSLSMGDGGIDLAPLQEAQSSLPVLVSALDDASAQVADIDHDRLLPVVSDAVSQLTEVIEQAQPAMHLLEEYLPTILDLAGVDGPKQYLVVFQNNAESRAGGGNPSATAVITVDNGKIALEESLDAVAFTLLGRAGTYLYDFPAETASLYEDDTTGFSQNYSRTPDFPTTVEMFQDLWEEVTGKRFDGVVSIDPVVLSYMLNATGPVPLPNGEQLNPDNTVQLLLSDTYERFGMDGDATDAFFAMVTSTFFSALSSGNWAPLTMFEQMNRAASEQRVRLWFPDPKAEALVREVGLDGSLTVDNSEVTQVGLFLNDAAYSKFEYHLTQSIAISCVAPSTVTVTTTLTNTLPDSIVSGYTLGWRNSSLGVAPRSMILDVLAFAPPGATITSRSPETSELKGWDRSGVEKGHAAQSITVLVPKGETREVSYTMELAPGTSSPLQLRYTPTVGETPVTVAPECEAMFGEVTW